MKKPVLTSRVCVDGLVHRLVRKIPMRAKPIDLLCLMRVGCLNAETINVKRDLDRLATLIVAVESSTPLTCLHCIARNS